ncbi:fatty acid-binding protein, muscle-like [Macrosteles quadrilineatus]|uniref:fatty acid-binding protein, muscle-like n=1 Tax=Macrosteles quadrilineatus TaxID=74068 RepID=UPI0023E22165|nr:fatty acid-binding protein, muscle-like [Macrosteles quadrilineatus]
MVKLALVCLAAVVVQLCAAAEDKAALAPVLGKKYKLASSENFEEVMKELGVGWITRKLGNAASPVIELTESNGEYSLTSKSTFKNTDLRFRVGQEFQEETPDGRTVKSMITQEGNKLTHVQQGEKTTTIIRTFTPEEVKMVIKVGDITATRIYKPE